MIEQFPGGEGSREEATVDTVASVAPCQTAIDDRAQKTVIKS